MRHPFIRRAGALLCASALALAACGDDDAPTTAEDGSTETSAPATTDETSTIDDPPTSAATIAEPSGDDGDTSDGPVIEVRVAEGSVAGGGRHEIELGSAVTIRVTSDVTDHVHLHGYDVLADVAAGDTAELTFDATIPGVFEVELEEAGLPLLELEIS